MDISTRNRSIIYTLLRRYNGGMGKGVNYCNMTHGNMAGNLMCEKTIFPRNSQLWNGVSPYGMETNLFL